VLIVLDEFILVGEHAVATIDIALGEWLRSLLKEPFAYLWLMGTWGVEPGFWQGVRGMVDPGWTRYLVATAEPSTEAAQKAAQRRASVSGSSGRVSGSAISCAR